MFRLHLSEGHLSLCKSAPRDTAADTVSAKEREREREEGGEGERLNFIFYSPETQRGGKGKEEDVS